MSFRPSEVSAADASHPLQLSEPLPLSRHPAAVYLHGLAPGSRRTMRQALDEIAWLLTAGVCDADTLDWAALRYEQTSAVQSVLLDCHEATTVAKIIAALRRVLLEARKLKLINAEDYETAVSLPKIKTANRLRCRALSRREIAALFEACDLDGSLLGGRDAALIAILRGAVLRRSEVVKLRLEDFSTDGTLVVRQGKGNKDRTTYLNEGAIARVNAWLDVRGKSPGALLYPIRRGGHIKYNHMTPQSVLWILQKRSRQANLQPFSPHDFRRTFCSDLLSAGVDIVTVQKLAGHSSPTTTARYDRRGEETKWKAVQVLEF